MSSGRVAPLAGGLVALVGALLWLWHTPPVGDLAAQTAWAQLAARSGYVPWFARWYSGLPVGGYSLVSPQLMAWFGVRTVGALATVATGLAAGALLRDARRPVLGAAVFGLAAVADLYSGRLTFALGGVFALLALVAAERERPAVSGVLTGLATVTSPVAGLFLLVPAAAYLLTGKRRAGLVIAATFAVVGGLDAVVFPSGGREPFAFFVLRPALFIPVAAALMPVGWRVRVGLLFGAAAVAGAYLVTSPVGSNVTRLSILVAVPTLVAATDRVWVLPVAAWLAIWPWHQLNDDLAVARHPSAQVASTRGLVAELETFPPDHRVEIVEPRTHWAVTRVTDAGVTVARGWERQADEGRNPLFYGRSPLTAQTYRAWLDAHAVAWVALPSDTADIDFGSAAEGALVRAGLPYLTQVWADGSWTVYAVNDPAPVSSPGATVTRLTDTGADVTSTGPATVTLSLRWSPWFVVDGGRVERSGDLVRLVLTRGGEHRLHAVWRWP
jgi:hypothetical protein